MNIVLCSLFRHSLPILDRYFEQAENLQRCLRTTGDALCLILGYGDSEDGTSALLWEYASFFGGGAILLDVSHGGPSYGSIENAERFRQLARSGNKVLAAIPADADAAIWIESDLVWNPGTLLDLIGHLDHLPAVAPMVLHQANPGLYAGTGPFFYDTFAFRRRGIRFSNLPPYHPDLDGHLLRVESAGSCLAIRGEIARRVRSSEEDCIVGLCRQIEECGGQIWCDPALTVYHP